MKVNRIPWMPEPISIEMRTLRAIRISGGEGQQCTVPVQSWVASHGKRAVEGSGVDSCPVCGAARQGRLHVVETDQPSPLLIEYRCGSLFTPFERIGERPVIEAGYVSDVCISTFNALNIEEDTV